MSKPSLSSYESHEKRLIQERVIKNGNTYLKLVKLLGYLLNDKTKKTDILELVLPKIEEKGLHLERVARRNKQALYCWICEHIEIFPDLESIIHAEWPFENKSQVEDIDELSSPPTDPEFTEEVSDF